jgi:alpha-1,6-mannosyltransferase
MLLFTAAALYCAVRRDWTLAFPALTAAVLIKFTTGLLGPLLLVWAWRTARDRAERRRIALGLGLAALLAVAAYLPFWEGLATFRAITSASANALNSPGWLLREALERSIATEAAARRVVSSLLALVFGAGYLAALRLVWNGRAGEDWPWLGGFIAIAAYLLTVSWWFWPWYITWLLPLTALLAFRPAAIVGVVWSVAALAAYVPITFRPYFWGEPPDDRMPFAVALTTFIPALLVITALLSSQARRRISLLYEERDPSRRSG